jgi:transposase-like protein
MTTIAADGPTSCAGYRFPPEVISYAVWLYFRFPLSLRMVEEMLAARGIEATCESVRRLGVEVRGHHCLAPRWTCSCRAGVTDTPPVS